MGESELDPAFGPEGVFPPSVDEVTAAALAASGRASRPEPEGPKPLSVSEAVARANEFFRTRTFFIEGEVSELSDKRGYASVYFTIKDEDAVLSCRMWNNRYQASGVTLALGAKVRVTGTFDLYKKAGRAQLDVSKIVLAGDGDLRARVARLAAKLAEEGLMDASRKRPVPWLPERIGLVTSPRGAVVHDVLRTLRRRFPLATVVFAGVPVEGKDAPRGLIGALDAVVAGGAEVALLVRGGGSFEDLMPFNDEALARAIAVCPVPVVTGIGHEPDTCIADMVADRRASTPTAAAEAVSPQPGELDEALNASLVNMTRRLSGRLNSSAVRLEAFSSRPLFSDPYYLLASEAQGLDLAHSRLAARAATLLVEPSHQVERLSERLARAIPQSLEVKQARLQGAEASLRTAGARLLAAPGRDVGDAEATLARLGNVLLDTRRAEASLAVSRLNDLSPLQVLSRGWAIATDKAGGVVRSASAVHANDRINVTFADGALACTVEGPADSGLFDRLSLEEDHD